MNCETHSINAHSPESRKQTQAFTGHLFRALLIAAVVALICLALFLSMGHIKSSQSGTHLAVALVYSVLISVPSMFLLHLVGNRYSDKYPRMVYLFYSSVLLVTASFGVLAGGLLLQFVGIFQQGRIWHEFWADIYFSVVISQVVGLTMASYETQRYKLQATTLELRTRQVEQERAYKLLAEAQLSSLESRIHPHFLFNTLNSIAALIPGNPQLAEDTVGKLASLLRFSLGANHSSLVPLGQEMEIVRDYLEIEKTRFGKRLSYSIEVPEDILDVKVPPLALQSLVENAVKHVVSQRSEGATIQITGAKDSGRVRLVVLDDGPGFSLDAIKPEHGLGNLIARLELLFGNEGRLDVTRENEKTAVSLSFPCNGRA
jgi:sensor histidine kinase YesM